MPIQSLIWTALPNGLTADGRGLRLSVLVSPRLEPETAPTRLDSFADFASWPKTLSSAKYTVKLGTKTLVLTDVDVDNTLGKPDVAAWAALFPADTFVRAFAMRDHSNDTIVSYDTVAMHKLVADVYTKMAATATDELPTIADLRADNVLGGIAKVLGELDRTYRDKKTAMRDIGQMFEGYKRDRFKGIDVPSAPLGAFQLFHTPPSKPTTQTVTPNDPARKDVRPKVTWQTHERTKFDATTAAQAVKEIDFHQIVAAMNQYPTLLRRLGLVVDLIVPRASFTLGTDLPLSVAVELPPAATVTPASRRVTRRAASPTTHTRLTATAFSAVSRPTPDPKDLRVAGGLLQMDAERFALLQADVDGAGHKLLGFVRSLGAHGEARQVDPVTKLARRMGAPALRNAGLMLVQRQRGDALTVAMTRNKTRNTSLMQAFTASTAPAPDFHAEDLVRGWRVDIWDAKTRRWRSLCERVADYTLAGGAVTMNGLREETTVRLAATSSADGSNAGVMYLHEALTVWNGWSLAAQQPGLSIAPNETLRDASADVPNGIRLKTSFVSTPGSLPRLRYGRSYAMRARAVDLAGNSLPPSDKSYAADDAAATAAPTPYLRFEPIQPPSLALVQAGKSSIEAPLAGESMARIAVRSFNDRFDDPAPSAQSARRWAVPARTPQREAELHGALDGTEWGTPTQFALLAERDKELASVELALAGPLVVPGEVVPPATYAVLGDGATQVPYLPDPLCTSIMAILTGHPSARTPVLIEVPLYPDARKWPDAAPFFVRVYEAPNEVPRFDAATRTLLIPTPKAVRATLRLSAMPGTEALKLLGVWNWIPEALRTTALRRAAAAGRLWPLTPWREVEIVHAVQRPLLLPTVTGFLLERPLGATWVKPGIVAKVHRSSTDRVDLSASWHEPRDVGTGPLDVAKRDTAFSVKITDPLGYGGIVEHILADAKDPDLIALGPIKPVTRDQQNAMPPKIHEFGDTRYRRVEYRLVGTSRFREYMPPELLVDPPPAGQSRPTTTDEHITLDGPIVRDWALNSAPPPAPEVLYIVPTFGWTRVTDAQGKRTSWRRGGGLRVWLDRPWNVTGYGEMLGVVLPPVAPVVEPNDPPYKHTVTQWGNDPVWKSPFVSGVAPKPANFPLRRTAPDPTGAWLPPGAPATEADQPNNLFTTQNVPHAGLIRGNAAGRVDVVPHDVYWDADRRLWYCDIEIDHGESYFPFIRLALARYQPSSLYDAIMSNVVLADFASLTPDRWLSVARTDAQHRQVRVFGMSHEESAGYHEAYQLRTQYVDPSGKIQTIIPTGISKTNVIEVWVEQLTASQSEDFGWRRVADGVPTPVLTSTLVAKKSTAGATTASAKATDAARTARARTLMQQRNYEAVAAESLLEATLEWPTLWSGSVLVPLSTTPGTRSRVVVAEYEEYLVDDSDAYDSKLERKERRLVFVEHVELT